jgi:hypothetical protein
MLAAGRGGVQRGDDNIEQDLGTTGATLISCEYKFGVHTEFIFIDIDSGSFQNLDYFLSIFIEHVCPFSPAEQFPRKPMNLTNSLFNYR